MTLFEILMEAITLLITQGFMLLCLCHLGPTPTRPVVLHRLLNIRPHCQHCLMACKTSQHCLMPCKTGRDPAVAVQATRLARAMVTKYGMSEALGKVAINYEDNGRSLSSETRRVVESEVGPPCNVPIACLVRCRMSRSVPDKATAWHRGQLLSHCDRAGKGRIEWDQGRRLLRRL